MNAIATTEPVSAATLEIVLGTGDLSKLSPAQRVEYMMRVCQSVGINPLTRPFRFLSFNGQTQMYATKDCTDQLRALHGISLKIVDKRVAEGLFVVTAQARTKDGREDEDIGAVPLPPSGESRANALMKCNTKAKRRVTLSISGLGFLSEDELDTMPGAYTFDAEAAVPIEHEKSSTKPETRREAINRETPLNPTPPQPKAAAAGAEDALRGWSEDELLKTLEISMRDCGTLDAVNRVIAHPQVQTMLRNFKGDHKAKLEAIIAAGIAAHAAAQHPPVPPSPPPADDGDPLWPGDAPVTEPAGA